MRIELIVSDDVPSMAGREGDWLIREAVFGHYSSLNSSFERGMLRGCEDRGKRIERLLAEMRERCPERGIRNVNESLIGGIHFQDQKGRAGN